ncbi:hypothetical protein [Candidatus Nitrosotenuis cloacae]|uniref:hypothetical protein n=1 Tax=Candidatus Nitrosotenuis cloacae TaxID=1603555 RepID=UPI002282111C|nr:hypothetical protein [Candidatus Nitrosotenuis cloacae]
MEVDKAKIAENLFDPDVSVILAELEHGPKESKKLAEDLAISEDEIKSRLGFLIGAEFVLVSESPLSYSVDASKISQVMENDENYKNVVDGLTELDSYLN